MKIVSFVKDGSGSHSNIVNQFFDYLPDGIFETKDPLSADVFFIHVSNGHSATIGTVPSSDGISLANIAYLKEMLGVFDKPGILYFDSFGLSREDNRTYPDFVRDIDIPVAVVEIPDHPNAYTTHFTDERRFYRTHRFQRVPKSLLILRDQFDRDGIPEMLVSLLKKNVLDKVVIAGTSGLDFNSSEVAEVIRPYLDRIEPVNAGWPDGVRTLLNSVEFFLTTQPTHGVELMGIEAGFCGAKPIYPDVSYYRAVFDYEDCDVAFYDYQQGTESLEAIVGAGYSWDKDKQERFLSHCSGTRKLPKFWEHVLETVA